MKERLKWLCVGVGVMFGMQLIILLIVHNLIPVAAPPGFSSLLATIVYTLVAFLAGGFVIGLMAERIEVVEPVVATVVTLAIDVLTTFAGGLSGMFLFSFAVRQGDYGVALTIGCVAVVAALAGALAGERLAVPVESWIDQALMILGLAGLVMGPYIVISSAMTIPRSVTIAFGILLLGGIWLVSHHFHKQDEEEEAMSIRPEATRESH
jgi:hypothetical protein